MVVDYYLVYQFIRRLATPFEEWDAFKLGIIDKNGNILKSRKSLLTIKERESFGLFDLLVLNMKKLLAKIPGGSTKFASYAAALFLIREFNEFSESSLLSEETANEYIQLSTELFLFGYSDYINEQKYVNNKKHHLNEKFDNLFSETTVSAGSGAIAGIGIGPDGEPGLYKKTTILKRKMPKLINLDNVSEDQVEITTKQRAQEKRYKKRTRPATLQGTIPSRPIA